MRRTFPVVAHALFACRIETPLDARVKTEMLTSRTRKEADAVPLTNSQGCITSRDRHPRLGFHQGDVVAAYLKGLGFVGIGQLTSRAKPIREVAIHDKPLLGHNLRCANMGDNVDSNDLCEYVATVKWIQTVERANAKWKPKAGIYTTTLVRASLDGQPETIKFLDSRMPLE